MAVQHLVVNQFIDPVGHVTLQVAFFLLEQLLKELAYEKPAWMLTVLVSRTLAETLNKLKAGFGFFLILCYFTVFERSLEIVLGDYELGEALE